MSSTSDWIDDPQAEELLKRFGLTWTRAEVNLANIDTRASNKGRVDEKIDEVVATTYGVAMLNGDRFPAIVVNEYKPGKYRLVSGRHRCRAAELSERTHVSAYVVKSDDDFVLENLPLVLNLVLGKAESEEARVAGAARMMTAFGRTAAEAGRIYGLSGGRVQTYVRGQQIITELAAEGLNTTRLPITTAVNLGVLRKRKLVMVAAAKLICAKAISGNQAIQMIAEVNKANTELQGMSILSRWEEQAARENQSGRVSGASERPRRRTFLRLIRSLATFLAKPEHRSLSAIQITEKAEQEALRNDVLGVTAALTALFNLGESRFVLATRNGHHGKPAAKVKRAVAAR